MDVISDQTGVRSFEAEMAVIGSLCIDPEKVAGEVFHRLRPDDFGDQKWKALFCAAREIWLNRGALDPVTLAAAAGKDAEKALANAMMQTPTAANVLEYARIVAEEGQLRKLRNVGMQMSLHLDDLETARKLVAEAEGLLATQREDRVWSYKDLLEDYLSWLNDNTPPDYLNWGIEELSRSVKVSQGSFVVLGAPSSTGKTAFALQLAYNIARSGKRVGFFSYETPKRPAAIRIFANTAGVDVTRAKEKNITALDADQLMKEGDVAMTLPFNLENSGDWTFDELQARTLAERYDVIFVDYVQIIPGDPRRPRWEVVTDISMKLHRMAQRLGVTVIALSQVTEPEKDRNGKRRALTKEDLRESRQLAHDAEVVLMMDLTKPGDYSSERELRIVKNKDGGLGKIWLSFDPQHMRFKSCEKPDHLKRAEYREEMNRLAKDRKAEKAQQTKQQYHQPSFEELGDDEEIPF